MEKRTLGNSTLAIAPLMLGGNVFDWTADEATSFAVLDAFVAQGGNSIDTADVYSAWVPGHEGRRERDHDRQVAQAQRQAQLRSLIGTKVGMLAPHAASSARASSVGVRGLRCAGSASRRSISYWLHKDDGKTPPEDSSARSTSSSKPARCARSACRTSRLPRFAEALAESARSGRRASPRSSPSTT